MLVWTEIDRQIIDKIMQLCSSTHINLINKTHFAYVAELARSACIIVRSGTGPMHIAAATKAPAIVLFSSASNPENLNHGEPTFVYYTMWI